MAADPGLEDAFGDYVSRQGPSASRLAASRAAYVALAAWIAAQARPGRTLVVGINGAQGSGKSTLAELLRHLLERGAELRTAVLSLDDFYLTRAERERLARTVHPLLLTRGVPGTHDIGLAQRTLDRLRTLQAGERQSLPRFVKAHDDRAPERAWLTCAGPVDVVLFEG